MSPSSPGAPEPGIPLEEELPNGLETGATPPGAANPELVGVPLAAALLVREDDLGCAGVDLDGPLRPPLAVPPCEPAEERAGPGARDAGAVTRINPGAG
jgi:hypothetical protein